MNLETKKQVKVLDRCCSYIKLSCKSHSLHSFSAPCWLCCLDFFMNVYLFCSTAEASHPLLATFGWAWLFLQCCSYILCTTFLELILGTVLLSNRAASHVGHMQFHKLSSLLFFLYKSCLLGVYAPLCLIVQSVKCNDVRMRTEEKDDTYLSSSYSCAVQGAYHQVQILISKLKIPMRYSC